MFTRLLLTFQSTLPRGSDNGLICRAITLRVFQSTLPRGSDENSFGYKAGEYEFQSTLPRGSDHLPRLRKQIQTHFNPRSLAGATARTAYKAMYDTEGISIHAPSRERLCSPLPVCSESPFQSTLPRGSDPVPAETEASVNISIHAPSRERHR